MRATLSDRLTASVVALVLLLSAGPAVAGATVRPSATASVSPEAPHGLSRLAHQLQATPLLRGRFVQEKHLRDLLRPLVSEGHYLLSLKHGLLWTLEKPIAQNLRINANGIARRNADGQWQRAEGSSHRRQDTRLFLAVLSGDTAALKENFELALTGSESQWTLTLTPRSPLLQQIFQTIVIEGATFVQRISLRETQGDRTELILLDTEPLDALRPDEQRAYDD